MNVYLCGDSTAAAYAAEKAPLQGWGQHLEAALGEAMPDARVINAARGGRSTKSFLAEGRLQAIERELRPGDMLLIQFGHNDASELVWRHTEPYGAYTNNLRVFVEAARRAGASPVLLTPVCRRYFQDGRLLHTHGAYLDAMRLLARQLGVPLIDAYAYSYDTISKMGDEASRKLFMHVPPGVYPAYPEGCADNTHATAEGARRWADFIARELVNIWRERRER